MGKEREGSRAVVHVGVGKQARHVGQQNLMTATTCDPLPTPSLPTTVLLFLSLLCHQALGCLQHRQHKQQQPLPHYPHAT